MAVNLVGLVFVLWYVGVLLVVLWGACYVAGWRVRRVLEGGLGHVARVSQLLRPGYGL